MDNKIDYKRHSLDVKVIRIQDPVNVANGLKKKDITIANATSAAKLTLWEEDINSLMIDKSYKFKNLVIHSYQGVKYLSKAKDASFHSIEDIGKVAEDDLPENEELTDVQVIGVKKLDSYFACLSCSSKIGPMDDKLGRCLK